MAKKKHWMQDVAAKIREKGTSGSFGKATPGKIARAKAHGGLEAKRAVLAENFKKAARHKRAKKRG